MGETQAETTLTPAHALQSIQLTGPGRGPPRRSFSEPQNSLPAFVPQLPPLPAPALPGVSVPSSCLFPEESRTSHQTLGKQFFNLQLQTLIPPKLILQISTPRPRLCPRIP